MVIGPNLMVQLGLMSDFKIQFIQWDSAEVTMKDPSGLLGQKNLTGRNMSEVVMHTIKPDSTREAADFFLKTVPMLRQNLNRLQITMFS